MEGDAFGAGLLQHVTDRIRKKEEGQLSEVPLEEAERLMKPQHSSLLEKRAELEISGPQSSEKESVM